PRLRSVQPPRPGIAEPEGRQEVKGGGFGTSVGGGDVDQDVAGGSFGVLDGDVEVAVIGEDAGVHKLIFGLVAASAAVLFDELRIWKGSVRVLIEHLHV